MRVIKVLSTETSSLKEFTTDVTTWSQLKGILVENGIDPNNMKGMVKETRTTLEHDAAVLPTSDFTLFLTPTKVKSGCN